MADSQTRPKHRELANTLNNTRKSDFLTYSLEKELFSCKICRNNMFFVLYYSGQNYSVAVVLQALESFVSFLQDFLSILNVETFLKNRVLVHEIAGELLVNGALQPLTAMDLCPLIQTEATLQDSFLNKYTAALLGDWQSRLQKFGLSTENFLNKQFGMSLQLSDKDTARTCNAKKTEQPLNLADATNLFVDVNESVNGLINLQNGTYVNHQVSGLIKVLSFLDSATVVDIEFVKPFEVLDGDKPLPTEASESVRIFNTKYDIGFKYDGLASDSLICGKIQPGSSEIMRYNAHAPAPLFSLKAQVSLGPDEIIVSYYFINNDRMALTGHAKLKVLTPKWAKLVRSESHHATGADTGVSVVPKITSTPQCTVWTNEQFYLPANSVIRRLGLTCRFAIDVANCPSSLYEACSSRKVDNLLRFLPPVQIHFQINNASFSKLKILRIKPTPGENQFKRWIRYNGLSGKLIATFTN